MGAYEESPPPQTRPPHAPDSDLVTFTAAAQGGLMEENSLLNECRLWRATCPKLSHSVFLLLHQSCILQVCLQTQQTPCASRCLEAASSVPFTAGAVRLCANAPMLGLAARPWPARRAMPDDVPTCRHTARPLVLGQEPARFLSQAHSALWIMPVPRSGEKPHRL